MRLRIPVIVLFLAFTAVPTALRPFSAIRPGRLLSFRVDLIDVIANVAAFIVLGIAFAGLGKWRALGAAAAVSGFAEISQIFAWGRFPSIVDFAANVAGAAIGVTLEKWLNFPSPAIPINRWTATISSILAFGYLGLGAWAAELGTPEVSNGPLEFPAGARGPESAGRLEAHWKLDETDSARDASGNALDGMYVGGPRIVPAVDKFGIQLDGKTQYVKVGNPVQLRLSGSMTIMAWINSSAFPRGDAAIVSKLGAAGYQVDTTVDEGSRTIAFTLGGGSGRLIVRYGRTTLATHTWYHVAGVYDSRLRTLDVYLNGRRDNGCLLSAVPGSQHVSDDSLVIGKRSDGRGSEFAGLIDDVRIYSYAVPAEEIRKVAATTTIAGNEKANLTAKEILDYFRGADGACRPSSQLHPVSASGWMVAYGMLVGVAFSGFKIRASGLSLAMASLMSGFLLLPTTASLLPHTWLAPLYSVAGGLSVVVSRVQKN